MLRKYLASTDDGHDYSSFEFYSEHRAGSKANMEDAKAEAQRKYGHRAKYLRITKISRYDFY